MNDTRPSQETFLIRLWHVTANGTAWRGQAHNIRTGQTVVIHNLLDLISLLETYFPKETKSEPPAESPGLK